MLLIVMLISLMAFPVTTHAAAKLNKKKISLFIGKKETLKLSGATGKIKWSTTDPAIARVSKKGVVKGISQGKCRIIAKNGKKSYKCTVTVKSVLGVNTDVVSMIEGQQTSVVVTFKHDGDVKYSCSNENVVSCKWQKGWYDHGNKTKLYLTAKASGTAVVTVKNSFNKERCSVTVNVAPDIIADGKPHIVARISTPVTNARLRGVYITLKNKGNLDVTVNGMSGLYYMIKGGAKHSGTIWSGYHYYHESTGKSLSAIEGRIRELQGENITIPSGQTVQFYMALKEYTYITDTASASFSIEYNGVRHVVIVQTNEEGCTVF